MTQLQNDDFTRIESMVLRYNERTEKDAERRFIELTKQLEAMNARYDMGTKFYFEQHATLENKLTARIQDVDKKVDSLDTKFDAYVNESSKRTTTALSDVIKLFVSFLLGGGLLSLVEFLIRNGMFNGH